MNFGIPMGMTLMGLAEQFRKNGYPWPELAGLTFKTQDELFKAQGEVCDQYILTIIKDWGLGPYIAEKHAEARRYGYVRDRWGRIRFLPSVLSPNKQIREGALREAQAFGPQAGARGFYKQILVRVWREVIKPLWASGVYIEPLLDIHDDLLVEMDESVTPWVSSMIESLFNTTFNETIPITCKAKIGKNWK